MAHLGMSMAIVKTMENASLIRGVDYRLMLIGALLPDIVDKSLASILIKTTIYESRAGGHSLAFLALIAVMGGMMWIWRRWRWPLNLFWGVLLHDLLDVMWLHPGIFFWPLYGWLFPAPVGEAWEGTIDFFGRKIPQLDALETIGQLLLLYFFMKIAMSGGIYNFFRNGKFNNT
jgi:inner membrane protein